MDSVIAKEKAMTSRIWSARKPNISHHNSPGRKNINKPPKIRWSGISLFIGEAARKNHPAM
jgi:hypothetical protein